MAVYTLPANKAGIVRYRAEVRVGGRGSKRYTEVFDYPYEAEAFVAKMKDGMSAAEAKAASMTPADAAQIKADCSPTVAAFALDYLARCEGANLAKQTRAFYATQVNGLPAAITSLRLGEVTRDKVEHWITDMGKAGQTPRNIQARVKMLKQLMRDAVDLGLIDRDPTPQNMRRAIPKLPAPPDRVLSTEDEVALFAAATLHGDKTSEMLAVAIDCGLRISELLGLTGRAVEVNEDGSAFVHVWQQVERDTRAMIPTKSGKARRVPLTPGRARDALVALAADAGPYGLLFRNRNGIAHDYHNWMARVWRPMVATAGITAITPHALRHTAATRWSAAGLTGREIGDLLGHATMGPTERYVHGRADADRYRMLADA